MLPLPASLGDVPPSALEIVALSQYAVELRYDELLHPGLEEAAHALEVARQVFAFAEQQVADREGREDAGEAGASDYGTNVDD